MLSQSYILFVTANRRCSSGNPPHPQSYGISTTMVRYVHLLINTPTVIRQINNNCKIYTFTYTFHHLDMRDCHVQKNLRYSMILIFPYKNNILIIFLRLLPAPPPPPPPSPQGPYFLKFSTVSFRNVAN